MKKLYSIFLLLFLANFCFGQKQEKLPENPWLEIVEMDSHEYTPITKWVTDINIGLEGYYTKTDSLSILKSVKKLDSLTETLSITFLKNKPVNLKLKFMNELVRDNTFNNIVNAKYETDKKLGDGYSGAEVYIQRIDKTEEYIRNTLEYRIATTIAGCKFLMPFKKGQKRKSIFNPYHGLDNSDVPLSSKDMAVIEAIYSKDFDSNLKIAKKQFDKKITDYKFSKRRKTLWWVKNPIAVIILPFLISVFLSIYYIGKLKKHLSTKIKSDWIQFGLLIFITLIFADIIIIFTISTFDFLTIPDDYSKAPFVRKDTIFTTVIFSLLSIPILFLFRFIEAKIQEKVNSISQKTVLIFFSTGFLPFILMFILFLLTSKEANNAQGSYTTLANIFVFLIVVATLRALVSYFILKERSLIIENEQKISNLKELKAKAELKSLQSHINPHFLYNALNSIAGLVHTSPDKSEKMVLSLSNLFRYSINKKGKQMSTITEEVVMVQNYLAIESERFGERLQVTITVDDEIKDKEIPMFLLQPLIENAIKHGVSKIRTRGEIVLKIEKETNAIVVTVHDNGPDFPEGLVSGYGLQMVHDLLRLCYGDKASLSWENTPEKKISIVIEKE
jgi:sensor histidine kinase YesM